MANQQRYTIRCLLWTQLDTHKLLTIFNVLPNLISLLLAACDGTTVVYSGTTVLYNGTTVLYTSVSQTPGRGPVPGPDINYTGPREVLLEFVILVF